MTPNPSRWFEIYVQDMDRARAFYERVFDTRSSALSGDLEMWAFPQAMGAGRHFPGAGQGARAYLGRQQHAGLLRVWTTRRPRPRGRRCGRKLAREKMSIGQYGFIALAHDTEATFRHALAQVASAALSR